MKIKKCWLVDAMDYHSFEHYQDAYKAMGVKTKFEEVGCSFYYYAVFWIGRKDQEVKKFIEKMKLDK